MTRRQQAALTAAGGTLLLALATGALHSPFLLILPIALAYAGLSLEPAHSYSLLATSTLLLLGGETVLDTLRWWEGAAAVGASLLLALLDRQVRRWQQQGVLAERAGLRLPEPAAAPPPGSEVDELQRQLAQVRLWARASAVVLWEAGPQRARAVAAAGRSPPGSLPVGGDPIGWVAREGTPLRLERTPHWADPGTEVIAARVWAAGDVAWLLTWEYAPGQSQPPHEELAVHVAPLASLLANLAARREARAAQQRLDGLLALLRRIPLQTELGAYGRELLEASVALTGATGGCLGAWNGDAGEVIARFGSDGGPAPGARFTPPGSELALAVRAGTPLVREAERWRPGETHVANADDEWLARPRSLASLPLLTPSGPTGAMALWSSRATGLDAAGMVMLTAALPFAALHLDHVLEYGKLRERADRDSLTGLLNRRAFDAAFLAERLRFERYGRPLSLLLLDIDHFKAINDTYGHQAGDEVLRDLARVLSSASRDVDIAARFGGEEFVLLLPETPLAAAAEVAERVRTAVQQATFSAGSQTLAVRVSVGVSGCPEQATTPAALIGSADAALYQAKRGGRNRVAIAGQGREREGDAEKGGDPG